jgi:hypothetical protein
VKSGFQSSIPGHSLVLSFPYPQKEDRSRSKGPRPSAAPQGRGNVAGFSKTSVRYPTMKSTGSRNFAMASPFY